MIRLHHCYKTQQKKTHKIISCVVIVVIVSGKLTNVSIGLLYGNQIWVPLNAITKHIILSVVVVAAAAAVVVVVVMVVTIVNKK